MLSLVWYLCRLAGPSLPASIVASLVAAAANLYLMSIIISAFRPGDRSTHHLLGFAALCIALLLTRTFSQILLIRVTQDTVYHLQVKISKQVSLMQQEALEALGSIPVLSVLSDDINVISALGTQVPALMMNVCIFVGVLVYVLYLSTPAFVMLFLMVLVSTGGYKLLAKNTSGLMKAYRARQEMVLQSVSSLIAGSKELRLNQNKHDMVLAEVEQFADEARTYGFSAWRRHSIAAAWAYTSYFMTVGVLIVCAQLRMFGLDQRSALAAVFGILFLKGAIETIFSVIPTMGRAEVAFKRVEEIGVTLASNESTAITAHSLRKQSDAEFERIKLVDIEYAYSSPHSQFHLGPLSMEVRQGEILFIAGGNGAGKTSLLKLLCGLYSPSSGRIRLDTTEITALHVHSYRQLFSAVFQEFQVFKILDSSDEKRLRVAREYIQEFQLDHCVSVNNNGYVAGTLSRGQQKRLALAVSLLEDKRIHVFDEWAADQDPHFRTYFYDTLLPRMKREGKTVIAVTHDDSWYHVADRILWLSDGQLTDRHVASKGTKARADASLKHPSLPGSPSDVNDVASLRYE